MLTRILPGSVAVAAAFVVPEFSVGAGDLGDNEGGLDDPRRPAAVRKAPRVGLRGAVASPALARVRESVAPDIGSSGARLAVASRSAQAGLIEPVAAIAVAPTPPAPVGRAAGVPQAASPVARFDRPDLPRVPALTGAPAIAEVAAGPAMAAAAATPARRAAPAAPPQAPGRSAIEQLVPAQSQPVATPTSLAGSAPTSVRAAAISAIPASARSAASVPISPAIAAAPTAGPVAVAAIIPATGNAGRIDIASRLTTRVDGKAAGSVDFQQTSTGLKVRVGSIVEVLAERYDADQLARIRGSAAGNAYLSLAELQASGIPISYDPVYDEFNVGLTDTRPKAARKVHMDQISAPERGLGSTGMDQVRP